VSFCYCDQNSQAGQKRIAQIKIPKAATAKPSGSA
jgi:hypothetical protein